MDRDIEQTVDQMVRLDGHPDPPTRSGPCSPVMAAWTWRSAASWCGCATTTLAPKGFWATAIPTRRTLATSPLSTG